MPLKKMAIEMGQALVEKRDDTSNNYDQASNSMLTEWLLKKNHRNAGNESR